MSNLILVVREYETLESGEESLIAEFVLPSMASEGDSIALGRGSDVIQIGVQFDPIVRRGISRRHCLLFNQDGQSFIKPLDGKIQVLDRPERLSAGSAFTLFESKFYRSVLSVESSAPVEPRDFSRDTCGFGELHSIECILSQLIEHRQAFTVAMAHLDRSELEILRRLKAEVDGDRRQSVKLRKTIVIGAIKISK